MNSRSKAPPVNVAVGLFLISGFAALVYQVIWQRTLGIFSGVHIYSITMIVTAFMAGLGFGSLLGGKFADGMSRSRAAVAFGACEFLIGLFALISLWLYYDVAYLRLGFLVRYSFLLPLVHLLLLLFPTFLMGASLPLLSRSLVFGTARAAQMISLLYGANAVGASLGAFVTVWYLVGSFGFVGATRLAAVLNFVAAAGALWIARSLSGLDGEPRVPGPDPTPVPPEAGAPRRPGLAGWAALYGASGFIALSLQILWFRILDTWIKSSPYSFGHVLGLFLLFLGLGSLVGAFAVRRGNRPALVFLWGQWGISMSAALVIVLFCRLPEGTWILDSLFSFWSEDDGILMAEVARSWSRFDGWPLPDRLVTAAQIYVLLPLALLALPTFLMGFTHAYIQRTVQSDDREVGWRVGVVQTANIVGSILGSFLTGTLFLQLLGTPGTLRLLCFTGALFGVLAARQATHMRRRRTLAAVVVLAAVVALAIPGSGRFWARFHGAAVDDVIVSEDASSVVVLQKRTGSVATLRINGTGHSQLPYGGVHTHTVLGLIPMLLHASPEDVLIIGLGAGNTAWAAAAVPEVERLDVYEVAHPEYEVLRRFQGRWFAALGIDQVLTDPRIRMSFTDGRLALRLEPRKYDVIEADALDPSMAYSGNLYSREFFELSLSRLKPGGVLCTYVPTERTRRTVAGVFTHLLDFHSDGLASFIVCSNRPVTFDKTAMLERLHGKAVQAYLASSGIGTATTGMIESFLENAVVHVMDETNRASFAVGDINTDLFPRDEYDKSYRAVYK